jgi:hypothetical protein
VPGCAGKPAHRPRRRRGASRYGRDGGRRRSPSSSICRTNTALGSTICRPASMGVEAGGPQPPVRRRTAVQGPSTEPEHCDAPFRCNPSVAAPARVTFRKPRAIDMGPHHLRAIRRQGRKAVSPRYALVIHPMEAGPRPGIRDKVGHRLLVVAMKAHAEPNHPAVGCC